MKKTILLIFSINFIILLYFKNAGQNTQLPPSILAPQRAAVLSKNCHTPTEVNDIILKNKIQQGLPAWAKAQIKEDLSSFDKISTDDLKNYLSSSSYLNTLVLFKIQNHQVQMIHAPHISKRVHDMQNSIQHLYDILAYLAGKGYLPNTEFLVSIDEYLILPSKPMPIFAYAKDVNIDGEKNLILMPDWMNLCAAKKLRNTINEHSNQHHWENKLDKLFWRGGQYDSTGFRKRLVALATLYPNLIDAQFANYLPGKFIPEEQHLSYKYLISIDGVRCSWERLVWQLHSNSLVFKHETSQQQWYYKGIQPYREYVPIYDEASLLKGLAWAKIHPRETQTIIDNSTQFIEENLSLEDMYHYFIELIQEYSKRVHTSHPNQMNRL